MKICFFGDVAAYHLQRWAKYFADKGHQVHLITFNPNILDNYGQIKVHIVRKRFPGPMLISRALSLIPLLFAVRRLIKNIKPDIIHSHSAAGYAWIGTLTGFHPFTITPWGSDILINVQNSRIEKFFTKLALKKADLITCDGANTKEAIVNLGISSKKIRFITFGVDIKKFKPNSEKKLFLANSKIVISTRFLTPVHDVETLIRATSIVLKKIPETKFLIVGDGPQKKYLMDLTKTLGVSNVIKFRGAVSEKEMVFCLQSADIYVSTSLSESGLAASTAEAMACQLPIINTNTGDIGLWIKEGEGGFGISPKAPEILAEKIIYLLKNDDKRSKFGRINRKVIEERNNYYKEMANVEDIYKNLVSLRYKYIILK